MPTHQTADDAEYIYYSAESPGLSLFAIASVIATAGLPSPLGLGIVWWIIIGVAVMAAAAVVVFEFRRRRKKLAEKPPVEEVPEVPGEEEAKEAVGELARPTAPLAAIRNLRITSYDSILKRRETCNVRVTFEYQGPRLTGTIRVAIGKIEIFGFDEKAYGSKRVTAPDTTSWKTYYVNMSIATQTLSEGTYDLYAKALAAFPEIMSPYLQNVITIKEELAGKPSI